MKIDGVLQNRKRVIIIGWRKDLDLYYPEFRETQYNAIVNDLLSDLSPLQPGDENNQYVREANDYLIQTEIRKDGDVLTDHQTRRIRPQDREIYRIAIEMWNDNHRRLNYTDLPDSLKFHRNVTSLSIFKYRIRAHELNIKDNTDVNGEHIVCTESLIRSAIMNVLDNSIYWLERYEDTNKSIIFMEYMRREKA